MKKTAIILLALIFASILITSCEKAKEPEGKKEAQEHQQEVAQPEPVEAQQQIQPLQGQEVKQPSKAKQEQPPTEVKQQTSKLQFEEEKVPLITEVMTKEELQAYLKEKNILIITKENFKEPELVWEKMFDASIEKVSDLTDKGNCIALTGRWGEPNRSILFIDDKGDVRKKVNINPIAPEEGVKTYDLFAIANGGRGAAVAHAIKKDPSQFGGPVEISLIYYDEEGTEKWNKKMSLPEIKRIAISDSGTAVSVEEGNPNWSIEEWGGNLNISRIVFFDNKGNQLFEYKDFRNIGWGEFSGDGNYFAGIFAWQEDKAKAEGTKDWWGKLIYIDMKNGKILWERPFEGTWWRLADGLGKEHLAISEKGTYVATIDFTEEYKIPAEKNPSDYMQVVVLNKDGKLIIRVPGGEVVEVRNDGLFRGGKIEGWIDITRSKNTGLIGEHPYFIYQKDETIWEMKKGEGRTGRMASYKYLSIDGTVLWNAPKKLIPSSFRFTKGMQYLIAERGREVYVYRLHIDLQKGGKHND